MVRKYIGTSLSFCMQDILKGKVSIDEISAIVTSTAFDTVQKAFDAYYTNSYWMDFDSETVMQTLNKVWPIVCQPRLQSNMYEHRGHYAGQGFWLNTQTGEYTKHLNVVSHG
jgi:hypothetical protein